MTDNEAKGRLESFIDTFNICKEHDNALVAVSISKEDVQAFTQAIEALEQKEKTGKWIKEDMLGGDTTYYRCSECNELFRIENGTPKDNKYNFCPNCIARMVSE